MIRPRTASSLIILLEVLGGTGYVVPEALVEERGRIHAGVFQQVVQRNHFGDYRDVLARVQRHDDAREIDAEDLGGLGVEAGAVVVRLFVPCFQMHDHLDALLEPDRTDAEEARDVDDPDAPDLHVMSLQLVPPTDQDLRAVTGNDDHVVGDEPVSAFHQVEYRLTLSDTAPAGEE